MKGNFRRDNNFNIGANTFNPRPNFYIVCVKYNLDNFNLKDELLFIDSQQNRGRAHRSEDKWVVRWNSWNDSVINVSDLGDHLDDLFNKLENF